MWWWRWRWEQRRGRSGGSKGGRMACAIFYFFSEMSAHDNFLMHFENACRATNLTHDKGCVMHPNKWCTAKACLPCITLSSSLCRAPWWQTHGNFCHAFPVHGKYASSGSVEMEFSRPTFNSVTCFKT
jgi:hypothetical protein